MEDNKFDVAGAESFSLHGDKIRPLRQPPNGVTGI
jgi:hypothetical protein